MIAGHFYAFVTCCFVFNILWGLLPNPVLKGNVVRKATALGSLMVQLAIMGLGLWRMSKLEESEELFRYGDELDLILIWLMWLSFGPLVWALWPDVTEASGKFRKWYGQLRLRRPETRDDKTDS